MVIASGVSSMMSSTPVICSMERMFLPSLPMILPFISSLGSATTDTVVSAVWSAAQRWIAVPMISLARTSLWSRIICSYSRIRLLFSVSSSSLSEARSCSLASSWVNPEIRSSISNWLFLMPSISSSFSSSFFCFSAKASDLCSIVSARLSRCSSL